MKNVKGYATSFCIILSTLSFSQTATESENSGKWKVTGNAGVTVTANTYSTNWTGGEKGAVSWAAQYATEASRQFTPKIKNRNTLKLAFGQTLVQSSDSNGTKSWEKPEKSTDLVDFESLLQFTLKKAVDPFAALSVVSQFQDAQEPDNIFYINPLNVTESFGAVRNCVKNKQTEFTSRLGGAVRQLYDRRKVGSELTNDGGVEVVANLKHSNKDNSVVLTSQLNVYEAVFSSVAEETKGTPEENYWRYPDLNWENTMAVNLTSHLMLNLYAQVLYDKQIDSDVRLKETLSAGFSWNFGEKPEE